MIAGTEQAQDENVANVPGTVHGFRLQNRQRETQMLRHCPHSQPVFFRSPIRRTNIVQRMNAPSFDTSPSKVAMAIGSAAGVAVVRRQPKHADKVHTRIDRLLFLGTGSAMPIPGRRNMSSIAVILNTGAAILVDCGEGTQYHIKASTILTASKIEMVLLTHLHADHCYGVFGLLQAIAVEGRKEPLLMVGPTGIQEMVQTVLEKSGGWFPEDTFEIKYLEIPSTDVLTGEDLLRPDAGRRGFDPESCRRAAAVPVAVLGGLQVKAVPLVHTLPDWGFLFIEPERPGSLDCQKAIELGVPPRSPLLGQLKRGEPVSLPDGSIVVPEQVLGPCTPGRKLAILQDTCDASGALEACRDAACVVHESTLESSLEEEAIRKGHSTSTMAARFAADCGACRTKVQEWARKGQNSAGLVVPILIVTKCQCWCHQ
eukprot:s954_g17.t1